MEDLDQSALVSSSSDSPPLPQPQFKYQFVAEPEDDEEEDEEEDEEDEDLEELEVLERKPAAGLSAAPVPSAPAPLLDSGNDFVPPAPRGPLPAAPSVTPERRSPWDPSPAPPSAPAPSLPAAAAPAPSEDDEPPARPPPPPPAGVSPQAEPEWTLPAPAPAAPPSTPAAPKRRGSSDKNMDLKEQPPANTVPAGHEDFPSVLLECAASLPSLSPLSAPAFKEQDSLGKVSAVLHQESAAEASQEFSEKANNPFLSRDFPEFSELEYSQMGSSFRDSPGAGAAVAGTPPREDAIGKRSDDDDDEHLVVSNSTLHDQQALPGATSEPANEDRVLSADKTQGSGDKGGFPRVPVPEEYADFKPFGQVWEVRDRDPGARMAATLEDQVDSKGFVPDRLERISPGRESGSSLEDVSFPGTPDATYIACAPPGRAAAQGCPLVEGSNVENKTDEKKIEEKKAQIVTAKNTHVQMSNPFLAAAPGPEADDAKTENRSHAAAATATMPEGLTPDLVQEACESELNDAAGAKVAHEAKVDLVRASEVLQDSLPPGTQLCPSFEGSEATPSPVLPDIVMEAPLSSLVPGAGSASVQPGSSPLEDPHSGTCEDSEPESENPPPYEEAVNVLLQTVAGTQEERGELAGTQAAGPETEAPYISIACDLIKGTKLPSEPALTFPTYSEMADIVQPGPDPSEHVEESSPDSEPVDLFSDDSIPEVPEKQDEAVMLGEENLSDLSPASLAERESEGRFRASPPEGGKPYLESVQPRPSAEGAALAQREKIPLQVEALSTTVSPTGGPCIAQEADARESETFSDSSPIEIIDDFPTFASSTTDFPPQLAREYPDLEGSYRSEVADVQKAAAAVPSTELPRALSVKSVWPQAEDQSRPCKDASHVSKVSLLPPDGPAVAARPEVGSVLRAKVLEGEAAKTRPSESGTKASSPSALLSAELSKTSVVDLLYWRDIKKTGVVFGASLFLLLSLTVFSIVSVVAYISLVLLSLTIGFRIYKGVIQAIQKSDEGHPFRAYLESDVAVSEELVQKYSNSALSHVNCTVQELRRLFLVDDLVDSLKFAVLMWLLTYVGALFNGLTLLILALISLFSVPVIYERHQAQIDHYLGLARSNVKDAVAKIQAKIPGLKRKAD
ncbi:reticulon-4 isoform X1 [Tenrec ecaudatus]|uniref:reticulon-4 isoform X1 n=1 Tax=Tenrec ecaudatus TaxID=94439 RepID=UPI003F5A0F04